LLSFEAFGKPQQTILQFKGKVIEGFEILLAQLLIPVILIPIIRFHSSQFTSQAPGHPTP
jgi:hypothetical protein